MATDYPSLIESLLKTLENYPEIDEPLEALQTLATFFETPAITAEVLPLLPKLASALLQTRRLTLLYPEFHPHQAMQEVLRLTSDPEQAFYSLHYFENPLEQESSEWRDSLVVGSQLDAIKEDSESDRKCWARATIEKIEMRGILHLKFEDEGQEYDREVSKSSNEIAPYRSKSADDEWRDELKEGDLVDCYDSLNGWTEYIVLKTRCRDNDHGGTTSEIKVSEANSPYRAKYEEWISRKSPRLALITSMPRKEKYQTGVIVRTLDDSEDFLEKTQFAVHRFGEVKNYMYVHNLNWFGEKGLFDFLLKVLQDLENPLEFSAFHSMVLFLSKPYKYYHRQFALQLVPQFNSAVFRYLSETPNSILREFHREKMDSIKLGIENMLSRLHLSFERGKIVDKFFVELSVKFIQSPFLDRRIDGIKILSEAIKGFRYFNKKTISIGEFLSMIQENKILVQIFGPQGHYQMIQRSLDIIRLLADQNQLFEEEINIIWSAALTDDEECRKSVYKVIGEASVNLKPAQIELFVKKIASISPSNLLKDELTLLYELTKFKMRAGDATSMACDFLFNICMENEAYSTAVADFALEKFTELMKCWDLGKSRLGVLAKCVDHLRENKAPIQCLRIMKKIIMNTFHQTNYYESPSRTTLIDHIVKEKHGLSAFFENLAHFKATTHQVNKEEIEERLSFLFVLLKESYLLMLTEHQVNILWELLVEKAESQEEKLVFLKWLAEVSELQTQYSKLIDEKAIRPFFMEKIALPTRDFSEMSPEEFTVFKNFFLVVNLAARKMKVNLKHTTSVGVHEYNKQGFGYQLIESPIDLEGYDCLLKVLFEVDSIEIFNRAQLFVFNLYENFLFEVSLPQVRREFVEVCLSKVESSSVKGQCRGLILLKRFISECNKSGTGGFVSHSALLKGDILTLSFSNQIYYRVPCPEIPKNFEVKVFSNITVWDLRQLLAKKVCCLHDQFKITMGGAELKHIENSKTLRELLCKPKESFTLTRTYPAIPQAALLNVHNEFTSRALHVFTQLFKQYADQGEYMSPEGLTTFTKACTGENCQTTDYRIQDVFRRFDTDSDGLLSLEEFLDWYKNSCIYKLKVVWGDLTAHHYREDLKRYDDEDVQVPIETLPTYIINQDPMNFELFFSALSNPELTEAAWELIISLPTNREIYQMVENQWKEVLDPSWPQKLLYALQIIESFVEGSKSAWVCSFLEEGGCEMLYKLYMDLASPKNAFERSCATSLLRLLSLFILASFSAVSPNIYEVVELVRKNSEEFEEVKVLDEELPSKYQDTEAYKQLVDDILMQGHAEKILDIVDFHQLVVRLIHEIRTVLEKSTYQTEDKSIIDAVLELLMSCIMHKNELLGSIYSLPNKDFIVLGLLFPHSSYVRRSFAHSFKEICEKTSHPEHLPTPYFLDFLVSQMPVVHRKLDYTQFFDLLCDLIALDSANPSLNYQEFLMEILNKLEAHSSQETSNLFVTDHVLVGLLRVTQRIFSSNPHLKELPVCSTLVNELFSVYLFAPVTEFPKAKASDSRAAAYQLLLVLLQDKPDSLLSLKPTLEEMISQVVPVKSWSYLPSGDARRKNGYVGIVNLGCICYMNSMFQQLFMVPEFKNHILSIGPQESEEPRTPNEEVLDQLQQMFGFLEMSDRQAYNPIEFCHAFKDSAGQSVNVAIQGDTQEFLNQLFDKLESALSQTQYKELTQAVFGGRNCGQIICKECNTVKENTETFYTLSVDVKNSKTLYESLEKFIADTTISDYNCDSCNKSVEITKRTLLDDLPDYLIVHLQRFVFNFETFANEKINTRLEFPTSLSVFDYTKAGVSAKESQPETPPDPDDYLYELIGVVVQTGTAEAGHYFSFIRDRKSADPSKWFEINDSISREFNPSNIEAECFGGNVQDEYVWGYASKDKTQNAYMLVYEKVHKQCKFSADPANIPQSVSSKVLADNKVFMRERALYSIETFNFINELLTTAIDLRLDFATIGVDFTTKVVAHAFNNRILADLVPALLDLLALNVESCEAFLQRLFTWDVQTLCETLLICSEGSTRDAMKNLYFGAAKLCLLKKPDSEEVVQMFFNTLLSFIPKEVEKNWVRFQQYWELLEEFIQIDPKILNWLHSEGFIVKSIDLYLGKRSPFYKIGESRSSFGNSMSNPVFDGLIKVLAAISNQCATKTRPGSIELTSDDKLCLLSSAFFDKSLRKGHACEALGQIISRWSWEDLEFSRRICQVLLKGLNKIEHEQLQGYHAVLHAIFAIKDSLVMARIEWILGFPSLVSRWGGVPPTYCFGNAIRHTYEEDVVNFITILGFTSHFYDTPKGVLSLIWKQGKTWGNSCILNIKHLLEIALNSVAFAEYLSKMPAPSYKYSSLVDWICWYIQDFKRATPAMSSYTSKREEYSAEAESLYMKFIELSNPSPMPRYVISATISQKVFYKESKQGVELTVMEFTTQWAWITPETLSRLRVSVPEHRPGAAPPYIPYSVSHGLIEYETSPTVLRVELSNKTISKHHFTLKLQSTANCFTPQTTISTEIGSNSNTEIVNLYKVKPTDGWGELLFEWSLSEPAPFDLKSDSDDYPTESVVYFASDEMAIMGEDHELKTFSFEKKCPTCTFLNASSAKSCAVCYNLIS